MSVYISSIQRQFLFGLPLALSLLTACSGPSQSTPTPPAAQVPSGPRRGVGGGGGHPLTNVGGASQAQLREYKLEASVSALRVGRGANNSIWLSNATQVWLMDPNTGETLQSLQLPFEVHQNRDLLGEGRNLAFLRDESDRDSSRPRPDEIATVDVTNLEMTTFKLRPEIGEPTSVAFTRDLTVLAVNTDTSVRFYGKNPRTSAFDSLKAELSFPEGFTAADTTGTSGTLVSRNSRWAVTPIRRKDLKEAGLFLMDLSTRKTALIFKKTPIRKGLRVDAPTVYAFSDDGSALVSESDLLSGKLSVLNLASREIMGEIEVPAGENSVIDSISQPRLIGDKLFLHVTMFDPDASERSSHIKIFDAKSGEVLQDVAMPAVILGYAVISSTQFAAITSDRLFVSDFQ